MGSDLGFVLRHSAVAAKTGFLRERDAGGEPRATTVAMASLEDFMITISLLCFDSPPVKRSLTRGVPCV